MTKYTTKYFCTDRNISHQEVCEEVGEYLTKMAKDRWHLAGQSGDDQLVWITIAREEPEERPE